MNKVAVVGSRNFADMEFVKSVVTQICVDYPDITVVSGGARGVDTLAQQIAEAQGCKTQIFPADWEQYGKSAGVLRNNQIVAHADFVLIFWDGESVGTEHTLTLTRKSGKPFNLYFRPNPKASEVDL